MLDLLLSMSPALSLHQLKKSGATYDSIEGRFRIIRKEALVLKNEVESGTRPSAPPRGSSSTTNGQSNGTPSRTGKGSTPRKQGRGGSAAARGGSSSITPTPGPMSAKKEKTISGRITKPQFTSPTKGNGHRSSLALETDGAWDMINTGSGILTPTSLATNFKQESLSSHSSAAASVYEDQQGNSHDEGQASVMVGLDGGPGGWNEMASFGGWNAGMQSYGEVTDFAGMEDGV